MKNKIFPCIWFNGNVKEGVRFYRDTFDNTRIEDESRVATTFTVDGFKIMALNGGPIYRPNPTMSLYTICETENEINTVWNRLIEKGKILCLWTLIRGALNMAG